MANNTNSPLHHTPIALLENPTRENLRENFTKTQLQKHCRQHNIAGSVWVTKEELIERILNHTSENQVGNEIHNEEEAELQNTNIPEYMQLFMENINGKIRNLSENLKQKDVAINNLKSNLAAALEEIQELKCKIKKCEDQHTLENEQQISEDKLLLIGDSNLSNVRPSYLGKNCSIRTLEDADLDLLKTWVAEKLEYSPGKCVIYGGLQDLLDGTSINKMLDDLGQVVLELKSKNENTEVYVCELVPGIKNMENQAKIENYNLRLSDWCVSNGITFITTELYFRLGMGETDLSCYELGDESCNQLLSKVGVARLLDAISKKVPAMVCDNWIKVKENIMAGVPHTERNVSKHADINGGTNRFSPLEDCVDLDNDHSNVRKNWKMNLNTYPRRPVNKHVNHARQNVNKPYTFHQTVLQQAVHYAFLSC